MLAEPEQDERVLEVVAEYLQAQDAGQAPTPAEVLALHPELASALGEFFADQELLSPLVRPFSVPLLPQRLGDYEILGELGRGGMGMVYRARQVSLKRIVALKMIRDPALIDGEARRRFHIEAENAALLDHPHIVPIHVVGEYEGLPFFSMKLIEGGTLQSVCRAPLGARPAAATAIRDRVRTLVIVARAVHHAHQRGIQHRDLKPANILLDPDGTPFVADFGLARRMTEDAGLTQAGVIAGTPNYMAPEQASAEKDVTNAVDVYGLGAILFELLTGRPPFTGTDTVDVLHKVRSEDPPRPRALTPKLDRDLETVCLKCLEKSPAKRYGSAEALADELEHWLNGEPITARPAGRTERVRKWARRRPAVAALLGAVFILGVLGVGGITWQAWEKTRALRRAEEQVYFNQVALAHVYLKDRQLERAAETLFRCDPALRRWEWHYLRRLCELERTVLKGHAGAIFAAGYSSDGCLFATASQDGTVCVWDVSTGKRRGAWPCGGHPASASATRADTCSPGPRTRC